MGIVAHFHTQVQASCKLSAQAPRALPKPPRRRPAVAVAFHGHGAAAYAEPQLSSNAASGSLPRGSNLQQQDGGLALSPPEHGWTQPHNGSSPVHPPPHLDRVHGGRQRNQSQSQGVEQHAQSPPQPPTPPAPARSSAPRRLDSSSAGAVGESETTWHGSAASSLAAASPFPEFNAQKHAASQLTRRITRCRTWQELELLFQQQGHAMDFIHLSAMLSHLAHLVVGLHGGAGAEGRGEAAEAGALPHAAPGTAPAGWQQQAGEGGEGGASAPAGPAAHLGGLGSNPARPTSSLPSSSPSSAPDPSQRAPPWPPSAPPAAFPAGTEALQSPASSAPQPLHAPSRLTPAPLPPSAPRPMHLAAAVQQQLLAQQEALRPREAANCLWALARVQQRFCDASGGVPQPLLDPAMARLAWRHAAGMDPQELSSLLYASALLGLTPREWQLHACLKRLHQVVRSAQPQVLANSVWALGKMGVAPRPSLLRCLLQVSYRDMYMFTPQGLVSLAYGFAAMHCRHQLVLPKLWQLKLLDACWRYMRPDLARQLPVQAHIPQPAPEGQQGPAPQAPTQAEGGGPGGLPREQTGPPQPRTAIHASTLVRLLWSLVKARAFPSKPWLVECFEQVEQQAHTLNAMDVANALWALAQMRSRPPIRVLSMLMSKAHTHMAELPPEALACVIWAAAELGARPSVLWVERFLRLTFRCRDRMTPRMVANILLSLARLRLRPNRRYVHGLLLSMHPHLVAQKVGGADTVQLALALPALKHGLPGELAPEFQRLVDAHLPHLNNPAARAAAGKGWAELGLQVDED